MACMPYAMHQVWPSMPFNAALKFKALQRAHHLHNFTINNKA